MSLHQHHLPHHGGKLVTFRHRSEMTRVPRNRAVLPNSALATTLPVDCTGDATVSAPIDGNDSLGDCGYAMCDHVDGIRTFGQGKPGFTEKHADLAALERQYKAASGGDNGSDEPMLVGPSGSWITGLAADTTAVVVDHLDVDFTDDRLVDYCIDWFYAVCLAWSVPDAVIQLFQTGIVFAAPGIADDANGHYTPLADVAGPDDKAGGADGVPPQSIVGFRRLWTWGSWCWVSPDFVKSVVPSGFVTLSALQFNVQGYDSHGRHVVDVGAAWVALGGNATITAKLVAGFPAKACP